MKKAVFIYLIFLIVGIVFNNSASQGQVSCFDDPFESPSDPSIGFHTQQSTFTSLVVEQEPLPFIDGDYIRYQPKKKCCDKPRECCKKISKCVDSPNCCVCGLVLYPVVSIGGLTLLLWGLGKAHLD